MSANRYKILSIHPRKSHSLNQAVALSKIYGASFLHATSIYFDPALVKKVKGVAPKLGIAMAKRSHTALSSKYVSTHPRAEILKQLWSLQKKPIDYFRLSEIFQKDVVNAFTPPDYCISYDTSSSLIFEKWKGKSTLILDLTIGVPQYRRKVDLGGEYTPESLDAVSDFQKRVFSVYDKEIALADIILCGSEFVKESVEFIYPGSGAKCRILRYGADISTFNYPQRTFSNNKKLKFSFVGNVGWRKGANVLIEVWDKYIQLYPEAELHFLGMIDSEIDTANVPSNIFFHHRVSKAVLVEHLKSTDVFIFPSTFEGLAISVLEAMAMQLPIITTRNSVDVLTHGESGEIVEAGNRNSILDGMIRLTEDEKYREKIARNAYALSANYTWDNYTQNIERILTDAGCSTN